MGSDSPLGLYLHIPFCRAKCNYCDFNSFAGQEALFEEYTSALVREMEQARGSRVRTVYVGGGTPSVLPLPLLARILRRARALFALEAGAEISMEANPGTVTLDMLAELRALGVNRLSLGVQSLDDRELRLLGRIHSAAEAVEAFAAARQAGFDNINLDLIYNLPRQSLATWRRTLQGAVALEPDHLSLYALSVEEGTPLARQIARGALPQPDPDLGAEMYETAQEMLARAGFVHYEISNWARGEEHCCRHNLGYWRNEAYLGLGAGAHSWRDGRRWANIASPARYTAALLAGERPLASKEVINAELEMGETMMMGLRLLQEGVAYERFRARFGCDLRQRYARELADLDQLGLIEIGPERLRLSRRGRLLGNQVFLRFLPDPSAGQTLNGEEEP